MNKTLKVMTSAALLAGVVAPVAVTTADAANSKNNIDKVLYVDDDYKAEGENNLIIQESDIVFDETTGDSFRLSLPSGVDWDAEYYDGKTIDGLYIQANDRDLDITIRTVKSSYKLPLFFEVDGAEGEVKVSLDARDSVLTSGQYTIAVVGDGATAVSIASVKTIKDGGEIDVIRLDETTIGALYDEAYEDVAQEITLTLPSDFEWTVGNVLNHVKLGGGFNTSNIDIDSVKLEKDENKLTISFKFLKAPTKLGTIYLQGLKIDADKNADYGDIEVDLDGDEVTSGTMVVARYGDFGTEASLEGDVPTLLAGRLTDDDKDVETVEVLLKETVAGSWLSNRSVDIELPEWVKVVGVDVEDAKNFKLGDKTVDAKGLADHINKEIDGDSNEISFDLLDFEDTDKKKEFKIKFYVSSKADQSGDVTVKVGGRAGIEVGETTIAKVVAPVTVETEKVEVRTGIQKQALSDIVITEAVKGALVEDREVALTLPTGVYFTDEEPTITVEEGNVRIKKDSIDIDGRTLTFEVDGESTRASKIKVSGLALDLTRAVPEGEVTLEVGGDAIVQNQDFESGWAIEKAFGDEKAAKFGDKEYKAPEDAGDYDLSGDVDVAEFDREYVVKPVIAVVTTPAEGNVSAETVTLTIGSNTMKIGEKEVAIDAAPFIEASTGRTYLPLRAIANAVGANSVEWDNASRTATVIKGGLVAQMTIGQNLYVLNGSKIGMDGKAQIVSERTFLPVRALGNALGADVQWDAATQTVTIK